MMQDQMKRSVKTTTEAHQKTASATTTEKEAMWKSAKMVLSTESKTKKIAKRK